MAWEGKHAAFPPRLCILLGQDGSQCLPLPGLKRTGLIRNQVAGTTVPLRVFWDVLTLFLFQSIHQYKERE